jgi:hypothetical protein
MTGSLNRLTVFSLLIGLFAAPLASAGDPGVPYVLGGCSRVVERSCPECDDETSEPLSGSFTLAPGPSHIDGEEFTAFLVWDLVLSSDSVEARGLGLLVVKGGRASLLGRLEMNGRELFVSGSGTAAGLPPQAVHLERLAAGPTRFEIHASPASLLDADGDTVADGDDLCADTACGAAVNASGCSIEQLCPCAAQADDTSWRSHRQYVRCVIAHSRLLLAAGTLGAKARLALVKAAARSQCGRSAFAELDNRLALR